MTITFFLVFVPFTVFGMWVLSVGVSSGRTLVSHWRYYNRQPKVSERPDYVKRRIARYYAKNPR